MTVCRRCGKEHLAPRKFPTSLLLIACEMALFAGQPQNEAAFAAWARERHPEETRDRSDEDIRANCHVAGQLLTDLVYGSAQEFLVLRERMLGDAANVVTVVGEDPPAMVSVAVTGECSSVATQIWAIGRNDADALMATLRERLGEPDIDAAAEGEGMERMNDAFQEHAVHIHPGDS